MPVNPLLCSQATDPQHTETHKRYPTKHTLPCVTDSLAPLKNTAMSSSDPVPSFSPSLRGFNNQRHIHEMKHEELQSDLSDSPVWVAIHNRSHRKSRSLNPPAFITLRRAFWKITAANDFSCLSFHTTRANYSSSHYCARCQCFCCVMQGL